MMSFKNLKLLVLDNDDVMFRSSPLIQFHVEKNWPQYRTGILITRERIITVLQHQYDLLEQEIEKAKRLGEIPDLPNFNVVRNDVIRGNVDTIADFADVYYRKPLREISEALEMANHDKEMFLESRDATVEADGKLDEKRGRIPYNEIYQEANWIPYTKENVQKLFEYFNGNVISLTAHNGIDDMHGREFASKGKAISKMVPDMKHYGLRFHATEHIPGVRRPRNSKSEKIMQIYDLTDLHGVALVDDSLENCLDCYNHGGTPILLSQNKTNPYGFATVRSLKLDSILRELERCRYDSSDSNEILQKPKTLVR